MGCERLHCGRQLHVIVFSTRQRLIEKVDHCVTGFLTSFRGSFHCFGAKDMKQVAQTPSKKNNGRNVTFHKDSKRCEMPM